MRLACAMCCCSGLNENNSLKLGTGQFCMACRAMKSSCMAPPKLLCRWQQPNLTRHDFHRFFLYDTICNIDCGALYGKGRGGKPRYLLLILNHSWCNLWWYGVLQLILVFLCLSGIQASQGFFKTRRHTNKETTAVSHSRSKSIGSASWQWSFSPWIPH